ncbi:uncharacterized protein LOC125210391 [Salvia hispanica]|uniref:uncharacterized protein LOC125210391 n=1 Tax=Salvia hispanica TaxID=49212 RepID=UPI002009C425|nr:uncharacterized protein LOC125210391 [Salvia hispanica]
MRNPCSRSTTVEPLMKNANQFARTGKNSERSNSIFGYFIQGLKDHGKYPWDFISATATAFSTSIKSTWPSSNDIKILASCDQGILICKRRIPFNNQFFACKPATAQWQALPNPKLHYETVASAVVVLQSQPLRYLIARLYCTVVQTHCEMFDSESWRWEEMDCAPLSVGDFINSYPPITTAGRFVHWLTWSNKVVTLDVKKRCFECWVLPERVRSKEKRLVEHDGGLGLMCQVQDADEIELWANQMVVRIKADMDNPTRFCNNNVIFMTTVDADGGAFYYLSNSTFTKVKLPSHLGYPYRFYQRIFPFKSDINTVHLKPLSISKIVKQDSESSVLSNY